MDKVYFKNFLRMTNEMWGQIDVVASWTHLSINLSCVILDEANKALNYASTCRKKFHYAGMTVFFLNLGRQLASMIICDLHRGIFIRRMQIAEIFFEFGWRKCVKHAEDWLEQTPYDYWRGKLWIRLKGQVSPSQIPWRHPTR